MTYFPYYKFPTTVVFVDDVESAVDEVAKLFEDESQHTKVFTDQQEAINFINHAPGSDTFMARFQEALVSDEGLYPCHEEIYNSDRFNRVSCVVVDYDMPGMNGLALCEKITDKRIKKILLTGVAEEQVVINAFNRGVIDYFIRKHDPNSPKMVVEFVRDATNKFFHGMTQSFVEAAIQQSPWAESPLNDQKYSETLAEVFGELEVVEYYLLDVSGVFLLIDAEGVVKIVQTFTRDTLERLISDIQNTSTWQELDDPTRQAILDHKKILCLSPFTCSDGAEYTLASLRPIAGKPQKYMTVFHSSCLDRDKVEFFEYPYI